MKSLPSIATKIRESVIRMSYVSQSAHMGGSLSCVEILTALYFSVLKVYPKNPLHPGRDRFIFSKGHDSKALYATLAERGFFKKTVLASYEKNNSLLPGHPTRQCVPGVEITSGSLGHGLSIAAGMAFTLKQDSKNARVFTLLSDGECNEGSTWEAILFAGHHRLENLTVIVDYNKLQGYGFVKNVLNLEPLLQKWTSFNWAGRVVDGHNLDALVEMLHDLPITKNMPSVIIANTTKGNGGVKRYLNSIGSQYHPPTSEDMADLHLSADWL
ncbi:MAG: transketolase [bacterium]|nr:transketolase [bacterium]